jgi:hypothetical protein
MASKTQAGTTTGRRRSAHTHVTRGRPSQSHNGYGFSTRHTNADQACGSPRNLAPHEPPTISETAGQQPYRGFTCSYLCGPWGSLLQPKTPGRSPREAAPQAAQPHRARSPTDRTAPTKTYTTSRSRPGRKAHRWLSGRRNRLRTGRSVRDRPEDGQPDLAQARHTDASNRPAPRTNRRGRPTLQGRLAQRPDRRMDEHRPKDSPAPTRRTRSQDARHPSTTAILKRTGHRLRITSAQQWPPWRPTDASPGTATHQRRGFQRSAPKIDSVISLPRPDRRRRTPRLSPPTWVW